MSLKFDTFQFAPHPLAPDFAADSNPQLMFKQLISEVSGNHMSMTESVRSLIRQAGFVNLWFYLKFICGYSGPYDQLNTGLHVEVCNFRQRIAMTPGIKAGLYLPRFALKSQCVGETVLTPSGIKNVEDVQRGDILCRIGINGKSEECRVSAVSRDRSECFEIVTSMGRHLRVADDHAFRSPESWVLARNLKVNDSIQIAIHSGRTVEGTSDDWCVGAIYGDGGLTGGGIKFTTGDQELFEEFEKTHPFTKGNYGRFTKMIQNGCAWWSFLGLPFVKSINKTYPEKYEGNASFLRGLFDTDGTVNVDHSCVSMCSASKDLAYGVQRNLLRFGILSYVSKVKTPSPHGVAYLVVSAGRLGLENYSKRIGFIHHSKKARLKKILSLNRGWGRVYESLPPSVWKLYSSNYDRKKIKNLHGNVRTDNWYWMSVPKVRRLADFIKMPEMLEEIEKDRWWDFVKSIEPIGVQDIVHIQVEGEPEYIDGTGVICHNSTIADHGGASWELVRNPNLRIGIASEIAERAESFVQTVNSNFVDNDFHRWLYPEHVKENKDNQSLILTSRTKHYVDPNLRAITTGGSSQGIHVDLFVPDDPVGDDMLNSDRSPTADMIRVGNWLWSNLKTLVVDWYTSRILFIGTRYHVDDPFEGTMLHAKEHLGDWDEEEDNYPVDPNGEWIVYYRPVICRGESIIPAKYGMTELRKMEVEDPWTFWTQFMNRPRMAKPGEMAAFSVGSCKLIWQGEEEFANWFIEFEDEAEPRPLSDAVLVAAGDPAASEKRTGPNTSRSAAGVIARFSDDRIVLLEAKAGFVSPTKFFDWLFDHKDKYKMLLGTTWVEAQAGFKSFIPILRREQQFRNKLLNVQPVPALGEKQTTIKNILWPFLEKSKLFATSQAMPLLLEELRVFPSKKMDVLDMLKIAVFKSYRPASSALGDDDDDEDKLASKRRKLQTIGKAGY